MGIVGDGGTLMSTRDSVFKDGWVLCPKCWGKLFRVDKEGHVKGVYAFCKRCKVEVPVNIPKNN